MKIVLEGECTCCSDHAKVDVTLSVNWDGRILIETGAHSPLGYGATVNPSELIAAAKTLSKQMSLLERFGG